MTPPPVSVVIVSRHRPRWLERCLHATLQLDYPRFEIVLVACPAGTRIAHGVSSPRAIKVLAFDRANISCARNIGVAHSSGRIIAFLDDDAVPEPTWLTHLIAPFSDEAVAQAGGTTLGRNGISVQHGAARVDLAGRTSPIPRTGRTAQQIMPDDTSYPRLHGTNMAIRRQTLIDHTGFDTRFAFYLDETDLTLRIAKSGKQTVFAPDATVHHASGPSAFRNANRTPLRLFEIGASIGVFHQKHTPVAMRDLAKPAIFADRRKWLLRHMQSGTLTPDDVVRLMADLERGYAAGLTEKPHDGLVFQPSAQASIPPAPGRPGADLFLLGSPLARAKTDAAARKLVQDGNRVTVFEYSRTAMYHRVTFTDGGYWRHTGGIFGRELRSEPLLQKVTIADRLNQTLQRLEGIRSKNALIGKI